MIGLFVEPIVNNRVAGLNELRSLFPFTLCPANTLLYVQFDIYISCFFCFLFWFIRYCTFGTPFAFTLVYYTVAKLQFTLGSFSLRLVCCTMSFSSCRKMRVKSATHNARHRLPPPKLKHDVEPITKKKRVSRV